MGRPQPQRRENVDVIAESLWSDWAVLLEVADEQGDATIDPESLRQLVRAWPGPTPTSLYSPSRYALQVTVRATDPPAALAIAMSRWGDARRRCGLPAWDLVRAEVLTPTEFERELEAEDRAARTTGARSEPASERSVADELLRRALKDSVTGLPDREVFLDDVRRALATPLAGSDVPAVVTVALDSAGGRPQPPDDLLAEVGQCLAAAVRRGDPVARVGEAAFAALVTLPFGNHTDRVAERVVRCVGAAGERYGRVLRPRVGVATASTGDDPDTLMKMAEAAMGAARAKDTDCHRGARPNAP
jgi:GGDEF domain-containing protein